MLYIKIENYIEVKVTVRGCFYEKNYPGSSPANQGPRLAETVFLFCLYEKKLSRQTGTTIDHVVLL